MPTPVQHLVLAQRLLDDSTLPGSIRQRLLAHRGAFLFGNTAPDVQTVSGQLREETHFFVIPWARVPLPHNALFTLYPALRHSRSLPADHAAFLAGYICHLWLDVLWVRDIYLNGFGPHAHWGANLRERHLYHNILRTWCDLNDQQQLDGSIGPALAAANPIGGCPSRPIVTSCSGAISWQSSFIPAQTSARWKSSPGAAAWPRKSFIAC